MDVALKRLHPDDWPLWRTVRLAALADAPHAFTSGLADWVDAPDDRWRARVADVAFNAVAFVDDQPVGQVSAIPDAHAATVELISLWVSPDARGLGVGHTLIAAVDAYATSEGARTVELSVKATNSPARRLYERYGFATFGEGDGADEVRMSRTLL